MRNLAQDYIAGEPTATSFFARSWQQVELAGLDRPAWTSGVAAEIERQSAGYGLDAKASQAPIAVVTGQQPAIFLGPMYTVHKAVSAILLARRLERESGRRVVPVFWMASDDHDFEEARHAHFVSNRHEVFRETYSPDARAPASPLYRIPADDTLLAMIDAAARRVGDTGWTSDAAHLLRATCREASSLADWMARLAARLFEGTELQLFAPHWPEARKAARTVIAREIDEPLEATRMVLEASRELEAAGYPVQVARKSNQCNFFLYEGVRRCSVVYGDGSFRLPETGAAYSHAQMRNVLDTEPDRFSANVVLRPILQQHLMPTAAYVAGPGEIAYWAQLKPLFSWYGLAMPTVYPRASATIVTPKDRSLLERYGWNTGQLRQPEADLLDAALSQISASPALAAIGRVSDRNLADLRALTSQLRDTMPRAKAVHRRSEKLVAMFEKRIARLEASVRRHDEDAAAVATAQVRRLQAEVAPYRQPQDRVLSSSALLFRYGPQFAGRLLEDLSIDSGTMQEIEW